MHHKSPLSFLPDSAVWVDKANISSHIDVLVHPGIEDSLKAKHSVEIKVIGFDLPNLTRPDYERWRDLLAKWISGGVDVAYIALEQREKVAESLEANRHLFDQLIKAPDSGKFRVYSPKRKGEIDDDTLRVIRALAKEHQSSHFLLAIDRDDTNGSQMWIEGDHQPGSTTATDCYLVKHADGNPIFIQNRDNFDFLVDSSVQLL